MSETEEEPDEPKKKRKGISTAARKAKGRNLQNWVVERILHHNPSLEPDDVTGRSMGANGEDIMLSPAARKQLPVSIECKALASMVLYTWMDQAESNCPKDCEPIVVARANHRHAVVIVDAEWFLANFPKRIRR